MKNAESPDAYVAGLTGWQKEMATSLRRTVKKAAELEERVKWGHLVYFSNGPVCLIRAESARVLFGFWRGKRLRDMEPRLKAGGKYEMATLQLNQADTFDPKIAARLVAEAVSLNATLGNPAVPAPAPAKTRPRAKRTPRAPRG